MNVTTTKPKKQTPPSSTTLLDSKKKSAPSPRNPLKDLNTTTIRSNSNPSNSITSSSTSSISSSSSSSISIKPPKGCLMLFLPNNPPKNPSKFITKTPKSAPISKTRPRPPISRKPQKPQGLNKSENDKDCTFRDFKQTPNLQFSPVLEKFKSVSPSKSGQEWRFARTSGDGGVNVGKCTPVVNKIQCGSGLDGKEENLTPPVGASVSPEIQGGSSFISSKSACYGAGHILSGVTDKRKCRPRGILAVEEGKDLGLFKEGSSIDDDSFFGFFGNSRLSLVPAPSGASMHWLSSPSKEEDDQKESMQSGCTPFHSPSSLSSYQNEFSSGTPGNRNSISNTTSTTRNTTGLLTPTAHLDFECLLGSEAVRLNEKREHRHKSPASGKDSLGSYNAVCTPESDFSLDDYVVGLSWLKKSKGCMSEFESLPDGYSTPSLSPRIQSSTSDPADVLPLPGFSFQFANTSIQPSNSIDQTQLQKTFNDWRLGLPAASCGNSLQSQMRISWRDGLADRIFEMEDLDCCRLSSDDISSPGNFQYKFPRSCVLDDSVVQDPFLTNNVMSNKGVQQPPENDEACDIKALQKSISCAESMSTEGGDLITSNDSDWNLCYKNQLFEE